MVTGGVSCHAGHVMLMYFLDGVFVGMHECAHSAQCLGRHLKIGGDVVHRGTAHYFWLFGQQAHVSFFCRLEAHGVCPLLRYAQERLLHGEDEAADFGGGKGELEEFVVVKPIKYGGLDGEYLHVGGPAGEVAFDAEGEVAFLIDVLGQGCAVLLVCLYHESVLEVVDVVADCAFCHYGLSVEYFHGLYDGGELLQGCGAHGCLVEGADFLCHFTGFVEFQHGSVYFIWGG